MKLNQVVAALATQPAISVKDKDKVNNTDTEEADNTSVATSYLVESFNLLRERSSITSAGFSTF